MSTLVLVMEVSVTSMDIIIAQLNSTIVIVSTYASVPGKRPTK